MLMSSRTFARLSEIGKRRARVMYWIDAAIITVGMVAGAYGVCWALHEIFEVLGCA